MSNNIIIIICVLFILIVIIQAVLFLRDTRQLIRITKTFNKELFNREVAMTNRINELNRTIHELRKDK